MAEQSSAARLKGQRVRDPSGNELGKINDFVIDAASGQVAHVVISTGGVLGLGDKLRLIPGANLKQSASNEFSADMVQTDFEALPTISEKDLKAGRITAHSSTSAQTSAAATSQSTGQVIRASELKDKSIRSDNSEVGEIESIVIDLQSGEAKALIDVNSGFAGEGGKFVVPFSKLEVRSSEADHIGSSLMRSDFAATSAGATSATSSSSNLGAQSASIETPASSSSSSQIAGASATSPSVSTGTTSSTYPDSSASTTAAQSGRSETTQSAATTGISSQDTTSRTDPTESSTSVSQSTDLTDPRRSQSDATSAVSSADRSSSTSTAASTPGTTSTYPAITGDPSRSPGLADTANTSSDSTSPGSSIVTTTPSPVPADEQLTPTGRTSAEQSPASGATAMAIRQALDSDATLAHEDCR
jgi:sporulation protein YlmC with PRC-barrel domain